MKVERRKTNNCMFTHLLKRGRRSLGRLTASENEIEITDKATGSTKKEALVNIKNKDKYKIQNEVGIKHSRK